MPLGGSITHGVGSSDGNGYRKLLLETLLSHGYKTCMVGSRKTGSMSNNDHEGWRGFRIDQIDGKARRSAKALMPHVFTINAGSNDCVQNCEIQDAEKRMGSMLEYLWLTSPDSTVILSSLLVNQDIEIDSRASRVNDQIRDLARRKAAEQKKIVFVDMRSPGGPQMDDLIDGTHPNDVGYRKMANVWFEGFQEAVLKSYIQKPQINN